MTSIFSASARLLAVSALATLSLATVAGAQPYGPGQDEKEDGTERDKQKDKTKREHMCQLEVCRKLLEPLRPNQIALGKFGEVGNAWEQIEPARFFTHA